MHNQKWRSQSFKHANSRTDFATPFEIKTLLILLAVTMAVSGVFRGAAAATTSVQTAPTRLDFGNLVVLKSSTKTIALTNPGTTDVTIFHVNVNSTAFALSGISTPYRLSAKHTVSLTIRFAPVTASTTTASLVITSDATIKTQAIALTGTGVEGKLVATPAAANVGNVLVGSSYSTTVTLGNTGTGTLTFSHLAVSGAGFSVTGIGIPSQLPAGGRFSFTVHFTPVVAGVTTGRLVITSDASDKTVTIGLTGTGTMGKLSASPPISNIGSVAVGDSATASVKLSNSGTGPITLSKIAVVGPGFSTSGLVIPTKLATGQTFSFAVHFTPMNAGTSTGNIVITSDASDRTLTIGLSGTGLAGQLSATPSSASFGKVPVGDSTSQTIRLNNTGTRTVTISRVSVLGTGFKTQGLATPLTIAGGKSLTFTIDFAPSTAATVTGSLLLTSSASSSPLTILLNGSGMAATSQLDTSPTSLNFGTVNLNTAKSLNVKVTNAGNSRLSISKVSISGTGFTQSGGIEGIVLEPSQSSELVVTYKPTSTGTVGGRVAIYSTAINPLTTISLTGTANEQNAHSVDLSWSASNSSGLVGYNIYRGTLSGGPYTKLVSSPVPEMEYSDTSVSAGHTYYYVVTSVNSNGAQSGDSSQVSATVPAE